MVGCQDIKCTDYKDGKCYYNGRICKYRTDTLEGCEEEIETLKAENKELKSKLGAAEKLIKKFGCKRCDNKKACANTSDERREKLYKMGVGMCDVNKALSTLREKEVG